MRPLHFPLASFCLLLLLIQGAQAQPDRVYKSLAEVTDPQQVYILQLRNKRLKSLPKVVLQMVNLKELDLRGNRIAFLPDSIAVNQPYVTKTTGDLPDGSVVKNPPANVGDNP